MSGFCEDALALLITVYTRVLQRLRIRFRMGTKLTLPNRQNRSFSYKQFKKLFVVICPLSQKVILWGYAPMVYAIGWLLRNQRELGTQFSKQNVLRIHANDYIRSSAQFFRERSPEFDFSTCKKVLKGKSNPSETRTVFRLGQYANACPPISTTLLECPCFSSCCRI